VSFRSEVSGSSEKVLLLRCPQKKTVIWRIFVGDVQSSSKTSSALVLESLRLGKKRKCYATEVCGISSRRSCLNQFGSTFFKLCTYILLRRLNSSVIFFAHKTRLALNIRFIIIFLHKSMSDSFHKILTECMGRSYTTESQNSLKIYTCLPFSFLLVTEHGTSSCQGTQ